MLWLFVVCAWFVVCVCVCALFRTRLSTLPLYFSYFSSSCSFSFMFSFTFTLRLIPFDQLFVPPSHTSLANYHTRFCQSSTSRHTSTCCPLHVLLSHAPSSFCLCNKDHHLYPPTTCFHFYNSFYPNTLIHTFIYTWYYYSSPCHCPRTGSESTIGNQHHKKTCQLSWRCVLKPTLLENCNERTRKMACE